MKKYIQKILGKPKKRNTLSYTVRTVEHNKPLSKFEVKLQAFKNEVAKKYPNAISINDSKRIPDNKRAELREKALLKSGLYSKK